jgi:DNA-repair protein complementing XP-A cells
VFLLAELKDEEILPHLLRPNPHRSTYSNMMLFLREQVEAFAFSAAKWGSPEALDAEFERRQAEKKKKKGKKFEAKLKELRRKTRPNVWHQRKEAEHQHAFVSVQGDDGESWQQCEECGLKVEAETF